MKNLGLASIALVLSAIPAAGHAASDSVANAGATFAAGTSVVTQGGFVPRAGGRNWGGRHQGRWIGGWQAPGGWGGYRRPFTGFILPRYWINPSFYISNYGQYGFSRPAQGYSWARYYNDAVLADQYGRVADTVYDYDWDQYDYYDDARTAGGSQGGYDPNYGQQGGFGQQGGYGPQDGYGPPPAARRRDRDGGLGGALAGGAIGAIGGSIIAGRGDRTAGARIGGGLGALAGLAIDSNDRAGRGFGGGFGRPPGISKKEWKRWQKAQRAGYPGYPSAGYPNAGYPRYPAYPNTGYPGYPTYPGYPVNSGQGGWGQQSGGGGCATQQGDGSTVVVNQGYGNCTTTITIQSQPVTTTTTTVTEEVIYERAAARKRVVHRKPKWRPRPKPRCVCGS